MVCPQDLFELNLIFNIQLSGVNRSELVPKERLSWVDRLAEKRLHHMPLQYIVKEWDFRDLTLQLLPPVFIPRPETEVQKALLYCFSKIFSDISLVLWLSLKVGEIETPTIW